MSAYRVTFVCEKCGAVLAEIKSSHHGGRDIFVPQDIHERVIGAEWVYCDSCLNALEDSEDM